MKSRNLWLLALGMLILTALLAGRYFVGQKNVWRIGVNGSALVLAAPRAPVLSFGERDSFGDLGLKLNTKNFIAMERVPLGEKTRFNNFSYTHLQAGLYLVELGPERVFVLADPFKPEDLNPSLPIDFSGDWVILQRSSLLPESWPVPKQGWVVLNSGTLSKKLKALSVEHKKPIIRPSSQGTVWLEKEAEDEWQVLLPR